MLLIHTALHAEAAAIIADFKLKRQRQQRAFACFANRDIWLVESGIGKLNAAAAVGWLAATVLPASSTSAKKPLWLNVGIAGHANHAPGSLWLAHRIEDQASGRRWYPPMLIKQSPPGAQLLTVEQPAITYPDNSMVDMEASGFFSAAARCTSLELIHSIKVISDNRDHLPRKMKAKEINALFAPHLPAIRQYADQLLALRASLDDPTDMDRQNLLRQYHFSACQQHRLQRLLQRYHALHPASSVSTSLPPSNQSAKSVLEWLDNATRVFH